MMYSMRIKKVYSLPCWTPPAAAHMRNCLYDTATDILARVSVYLLSEPSPSFAPLLKPLINPNSVPETLIVLLLDWENPWVWVRQLREWIRLLRSVLISLNDDTKLVMEEVMTDWRERRRGVDPSQAAGSGGPVSSIPLGPGEWDEGLGIPLCVVCQGVRISSVLTPLSPYTNCYLFLPS